MKTFFDKMSNTQANLLMMAFVIIVLMIPSSVIAYAENRTVTNILIVESEYVDGYNFAIDTANATEIDTLWDIQVTVGTQANYDSAFYGEKSAGSPLERRAAYYTNFVTATGGGNYSVSMNFTLMNETVYDSGRMLLIPLDITANEISTYDFIRVTSDCNAQPTLLTQVTSGDLNALDTAVGEWLFVNTLSQRSNWQNYDNQTVYLAFGSPSVELWDETDDATFAFNIEGFNLTTADSLMWDDNQIYVLTILGCDIILITGFAVTTNFIDVHIDRKGTNRPKSGKKGKR